MRIEMLTFLITAAICLAGAFGVVLFRNPVHNALSLVATLFGVAVLFIAQEAYFLAAIQVIVYAGAIVILFLFVIMLLGIDRAQEIGMEPIVGQRVLAVVTGVAILGLSLTALLAGTDVTTGTPSTTAPLDPAVPDVNRLGQVLFTDYIFAFEITAVLLTIAVIGAVVLSRRAGSVIDAGDYPDGTALDQLSAADHDPSDSVTGDETAGPADEAESSGTEDEEVSP